MRYSAKALSLVNQNTHRKVATFGRHSLDLLVDLLLFVRIKRKEGESEAEGVRYCLEVPSA